MKMIARFALLSAALATIAVISNAPAANAEEPFCYECHDALPAVTHPHDPVESEDCTACHEDHGDAEELRLVEEGSALCYQCHDEFSGTGSMHPPVEDGECTECHNPHGSAESRPPRQQSERISATAATTNSRGPGRCTRP